MNRSLFFERWGGTTTPTRQWRRCFKPLRTLSHASRSDALVAPDSATSTSTTRRRDCLLLAAAGSLIPLPAAAEGGEPEDFYTLYPYAGPRDVLPFLTQALAEAQVQAASRSSSGAASVDRPQVLLDAIDSFAAFYPMYRIGPEKGRILDAAVVCRQPSRVLELGTFIGYSALRIGRLLPPGGLLTCVEGNPENAAVAREVVRLAGLEDVVVIHTGLSSDLIPRLDPATPRDLLPAPRTSRPSGQPSAPASTPPTGGGSGGGSGGGGRGGGGGSFDLVFLDHCKDCYAPDLVALESSLGLILGAADSSSSSSSSGGSATWVVADNVGYPGAPGFLEHLTEKEAGTAAAAAAAAGTATATRTGGRSRQAQEAAPPPTASAVAPPGSLVPRYATLLVPGSYEYDQKWNASWGGPKQDAVSVSVCIWTTDPVVGTMADSSSASARSTAAGVGGGSDVKTTPSSEQQSVAQQRRLSAAQASAEKDLEEFRAALESATGQGASARLLTAA